MSSAVNSEAKTATEPSDIGTTGTSPDGNDSAPPDPDPGPIKG